ncbi:MAG: hypothetical protein AB1540_08715 [Bdellovibrionota bacterium]
MKRLLAMTVLLGIALGCGKTVELSSNPNSSDSLTDDDSLGLQCGPENRVRWEFTQPQPTYDRSVDLLFVVDTSDSLIHERQRIASTIPAFVAQLSPDTDYRISVMLGHGGKSAHSGALYSASGVRKVLDSKKQSVSTIQSDLRQTLSASPSDVDEANGEVLMYSLLRSFDRDKITAIRNQGFYRSNAALSIIFVNDENDLCYRPDLHGFNAFPDFVRSTRDTELTAYDRYCVNADGSERVTPDSVFSAIRRNASNSALSLGAITHLDPKQVPRGIGVEDSIGHGVMQLVQKTSDPVLLDLSEPDYATALARLGNIVSIQLRLNTSFALTNAQDIETKSMLVTVDQKSVNHKYDPSSQMVQIETTDAGSAGSKVMVEACKP